MGLRVGLLVAVACLAGCASPEPQAAPEGRDGVPVPALTVHAADPWNETVHAEFQGAGGAFLLDVAPHWRAAEGQRDATHPGEHAVPLQFAAGGLAGDAWFALAVFSHDPAGLELLGFEVGSPSAPYDRGLVLAVPDAEAAKRPLLLVFSREDGGGNASLDVWFRQGSAASASLGPGQDGRPTPVRHVDPLPLGQARIASYAERTSLAGVERTRHQATVEDTRAEAGLAHSPGRLHVDARVAAAGPSGIVAAQVTSLGLLEAGSWSAVLATETGSVQAGDASAKALFAGCAAGWRGAAPAAEASLQVDLQILANGLPGFEVHVALLPVDHAGLGLGLAAHGRTVTYATSPATVECTG